MTNNLKIFLDELRTLENRYGVSIVTSTKPVITVSDKQASVHFNNGKITPAGIAAELEKLKTVVNTDSNGRELNAKSPTDIECTFALSDFLTIPGLYYHWDNQDASPDSFIEFICERKNDIARVTLYHVYDNNQSAEVLDQQEYLLDDYSYDITLKITVKQCDDSKWFKLDSQVVI
jgi:hypothetical protein